MRVFLTGATGVIGSRAVPLLVTAGHEVTALGRTPEKCRLLESWGAQPVHVSLFDSGALAYAMRGHDAVLNMATHIPKSAMQMMLPWAWRENDRIRSIGSASVANAAMDAGVSHLVQESFAPIYEDHGDEWIDESWPVAPVSYNKSLLDAEASAERFTAAGGTGVVLRFAAFYGPDRFMREMLDMIRKGRSPIPGEPSAYFTSIAQDDAASALAAALNVPSGTYNVAENDPMKRGEWVASLAHAAGLTAPKPMPRLLQRMAGEGVRMLSRSLRISNRKFRDASGWEPRYPRADQAWSGLLAGLEAQP